MRKNNICPKCKSKDIVEVGGYDPLFTETSANMLRIGLLRHIQITRYVCCSCGYTEEWIDEDDLEEVKKSYRTHKTENNNTI